MWHPAFKKKKGGKEGRKEENKTNTFNRIGTESSKVHICTERLFQVTSNTPSNLFCKYQTLGLCLSLTTYNDWEGKCWYSRFSKFNQSYITKDCLLQRNLNFHLNRLLYWNKIDMFFLFLFTLFYPELKPKSELKNLSREVPGTAIIIRKTGTLTQ